MTALADLDDQALLAAHVEGREGAFAELFARHRDRLWAVALRTTGNREDAADGLQEGMVAAFRRAASFRGEAAVTTWLHRVVVNACLDRLRAQRSRRADSLDARHEHGEEPVPERSQAAGDDAATDPARAAQLAERRRVVLAALATLPAAQRAAVVLVDMEGYSVAEAAAVLDCAPGTVKSRCSRARAKLATSLAALLDEDGDPGHQPAGNPARGRDVPSVEQRGPPYV